MDKKANYLLKQFHELSEEAQTDYLDKLLSKASKDKLKQKRLDIGKHISITELEDEAKLIVDNWGLQLGLLSQFEILNEYCGGFRRKGVYIIGGDPSSGKSTFAINLAVQFDQMNHKVHIVSYEDANQFVAARISIILDGLQQSAITVPAPELIEGIYSMEHNKLYEHLADIRDKRGLDVVVIDYIQFMALFAEENEYVAINNTMKLFRDIAKSLNVVLIAISQLNRGKEIKQSRFHGSGAIEKLADVAIIIEKDNKTEQTLVLAQIVKSKFTWLRDKKILYEYDQNKKGALLIERRAINDDM